MARGAGHSVDEYLETIYFLAFPIGEYTPRGSGSPPLASRVAEMLHVSRASAGEMLKRLEAEGLIERGERKEALLTATGRERAERVVRKHRIIERLLTDFMGYTAYEAHERADVILDRPPFNIVSMPQRDQLRLVFEALDEDAHVRVIVLRAAGEHFSSGGNIARTLSQDGINVASVAAFFWLAKAAALSAASANGSSPAISISSLRAVCRPATESLARA